MTYAVIFVGLAVLWLSPATTFNFERWRYRNGWRNYNVVLNILFIWLNFGGMIAMFILALVHAS